MSLLGYHFVRLVVSPPVRQKVTSACGFGYCGKFRIISGSSVSKMAEASSSSPSGLPAHVQQKLDLIPDVKIDESGRFKYILIKVYVEDPNGKHDDNHAKTVVRGRADCPYHGDVFDKYLEETSKISGIDADILGGGRIERTGNKILVFGYSQGYGRADHNLTCEIIRKQYPTHDVSWNNDGY